MSESRPVLAVDVDEVLAAFMPALVAFHNDTYGTALKPSDFFSYQFHEVWGGTIEESKVKMNRFFASEYFLNMAPIEGALDHLTRLKDHFSLHIVTSRHLSIEEPTRAWLDKHFPGMFTAVHFGNHYGSSGAVRSKPQMCADIKAVMLIDDSYSYAKQCAEAGVPVVLFGDYAWNRQLEKSDDRLIRRAASWVDVDRVIREIVQESCDAWGSGSFVTSFLEETRR